MSCKTAGLKGDLGGTESTTLISFLKCISQIYFSHTFVSWGVQHKVTSFYESKKKWEKTPPPYYANGGGGNGF